MRFSFFLPALLLAACSGEAPAPSSEVIKPDITLSEVTFHHWRGASLTLSGKAEELTYVRQSSDLTARGLALQGVDGAQLQVAEAAGNAKSRSAVGTGGAWLKRADGLTASATSFEFGTDEGGAQWFAMDAGVEVRGSGMVTSAPSLRVELQPQRMSFSGGVRTTLSQAESAP